MLDDLPKILCLLFMVAVSISEQGVLTEPGILENFKNDLQGRGDVEVVIPPDCVEMCDESGCVIYCPQPARQIKRCAGRSPLSKRFCCSTDGPIAPIFNLLPQSGDAHPPRPRPSPIHSPLFNTQNKLPGLTPFLDSKLSEFKNSLNKLKSLHTDLFHRKQSESKNENKSNACNYINGDMNPANEDTEKEKCQQTVPSINPDLPIFLKNTAEIILPNYEKETSSETNTINNPETVVDLVEDPRVLRDSQTYTNPLDTNSHQFSSLNPAPDKTLSVPPKFRSAEVTFHDVNSNYGEDSNLLESTTDNKEIIIAPEFYPLTIQSDPHLIEPIKKDDSKSLEIYEQSVDNDNTRILNSLDKSMSATVNNMNYTRNIIYDNDPKLSTKAGHENRINLIFEENTELPIQNEYKYDNDDYRSIYPKDILGNLSTFAFDKSENSLTDTIQENDSLMFNVNRNGGESKDPKFNIDENNSNKFEALYFEDDSTDREKLLIPLSQVRGGQDGQNLNVSETYPQGSIRQYAADEESNFQNIYQGNIGQEHGKDNIKSSALNEEPSSVHQDIMSITVKPSFELSDKSNNESFGSQYLNDKSDATLIDKINNLYSEKNGKQSVMSNDDYGEGIDKDFYVESGRRSTEHDNLYDEAKSIAEDQIYKYANTSYKNGEEYLNVNHNSYIVPYKRPHMTEPINYNINYYSTTNEEQLSGIDTVKNKIETPRKVENEDTTNDSKLNTLNNNKNEKIEHEDGITVLDAIHRGTEDMKNAGNLEEENVAISHDTKPISDQSLFNVQNNNNNEKSETVDTLDNLDTARKIPPQNVKSINDEINMYSDIYGQHTVAHSDIDSVNDKRDITETPSMLGEKHDAVNHNEKPILDHPLFNVLSNGNNKQSVTEDTHDNSDIAQSIGPQIGKSINDDVNMYGDIYGHQTVVPSTNDGVEDKNNIIETPRRLGDEHVAISHDTKPISDQSLFNVQNHNNNEMSDILDTFDNLDTARKIPPQNEKSINDEINMYSDIYGQQTVAHSDIESVDDKRGIIETPSMLGEEHDAVSHNEKPITDHPLFNVLSNSNNKQSVPEETHDNSDIAQSIRPQIGKSINDEINIYSDIYGQQTVAHSDIDSVDDKRDMTETPSMLGEKHDAVNHNEKPITDHPLFNMLSNSNNKQSVTVDTLDNSDIDQSIRPQIGKSINDEINIYRDIYGQQTVVPSTNDGVEDKNDIIETPRRLGGEHVAISHDAKPISNQSLFNVQNNNNNEKSEIVDTFDNLDTAHKIPPQNGKSINDEINMFSDIYGQQTVAHSDINSVDDKRGIIETPSMLGEERDAVSHNEKPITDHPLFNVLSNSNNKQSVAEETLDNSDTAQSIRPQIGKSINDEINIYRDIYGQQTVAHSDIDSVDDKRDITETPSMLGEKHDAVNHNEKPITDHPLFNVLSNSNIKQSVTVDTHDNSDIAQSIRPQIGKSINDEINIYSDIYGQQTVAHSDIDSVDDKRGIIETPSMLGEEHDAVSHNEKPITDHPLFNVLSNSNNKQSVAEETHDNSDIAQSIRPQIGKSINDEINIYSDIYGQQTVAHSDIDSVDDKRDITETPSMLGEKHDAVNHNEKPITDHPLFNMLSNSNNKQSVTVDTLDNSDIDQSIRPQIGKSINDEINIYRDIYGQQTVVPSTNDGVEDKNDIIETPRRLGGEHVAISHDAKPISNQSLFNVQNNNNNEKSEIVDTFDNLDTAHKIPPQNGKSINDEINMYSDIYGQQAVAHSDINSVDDKRGIIETPSMLGEERDAVSHNEKPITDHPLFNVLSNSNNKQSVAEETLDNSDTAQSIRPQIGKSINDEINIYRDIYGQQTVAHSDIDSVDDKRDITETPSMLGEKHDAVNHNEKPITDHPLFNVLSNSNIKQSVTVDTLDNSDIDQSIRPQIGKSINDEINIYRDIYGQQTVVPSTNDGVEDKNDIIETPRRLGGEHVAISHDAKPISDQSLFNVQNNNNNEKSEIVDTFDNLDTAHKIPPQNGKSINDEINMYSDIYGQQAVAHSDIDSVDDKRGIIETPSMLGEEHDAVSHNEKPITDHPLFNVLSNSNNKQSVTEDTLDNSDIAQSIRPQIGKSINDEKNINRDIYGQQTVVPSGNDGEEDQKDINETPRILGDEHDTIRHDAISSQSQLNVFSNSNNERSEIEDTLDNSDTAHKIRVNEGINVYSDIYGEQAVVPSALLNDVEDNSDNIGISGLHGVEHDNLSLDVKPIRDHPLFHSLSYNNKDNSEMNDTIDNSDTSHNLHSQIEKLTNNEVNLYSNIFGKHTDVSSPINGLENNRNTNDKFGNLGKDISLDRKPISDQALLNVPSNSNNKKSDVEKSDIIETTGKQVEEHYTTVQDVKPIVKQEGIVNLDTTHKVHPPNGQSINDEIDLSNRILIDQSGLPNDNDDLENKWNIIKTSSKPGEERPSQDGIARSDNFLDIITSNSNKEILDHDYSSINSNTAPIYDTAWMIPQILESLNTKVNIQRSIDKNNNINEFLQSESPSVRQDLKSNHDSLIRISDSGDKQIFHGEEGIEKTPNIPPLISESTNHNVNIYRDLDSPQPLLLSDLYDVANKSDTIEISANLPFSIPDNSYKVNAENKDDIFQPGSDLSILPKIAGSLNDRTTFHSTTDEQQTTLTSDDYIVGNERYEIEPYGKHNEEHDQFNIQDPLNGLSNKNNKEKSFNKDEMFNFDITPKIGETTNDTVNLYSDLKEVNSVMPNDNFGVENKIDTTKSSGKNREEASTFSRDENPIFDVPLTNTSKPKYMKNVIYEPGTSTSMLPLISESINDEVNHSNLDKIQLTANNDLYGMKNKKYTIESTGWNSEEYNTFRADNPTSIEDNYEKNIKTEAITEDVSVVSFDNKGQNNFNGSIKRKSEEANLNNAGTSNKDSIEQINGYDDNDEYEKETQNQDKNVNSIKKSNIRNDLKNVGAKRLSAKINDEDIIKNIPIGDQPVDSGTCLCKSGSSMPYFPEKSHRGFLIGNIISKMNPHSPIHIFIDGDRGISTPNIYPFPRETEFSNTQKAHIISERNIKNPKTKSIYEFVNGQYVKIGETEFYNVNENNNEELLDDRGRLEKGDEAFYFLNHLNADRQSVAIQKFSDNIPSHEISSKIIPTSEPRESLQADGISSLQNEQHPEYQRHIENGFTDLLKNGWHTSKPNDFNSNNMGNNNPEPVYIYIQTK